MANETDTALVKEVDTKHKTVINQKELIGLFDSQWEVLFVNDAFITSFGVLKTELIGKKLPSYIRDQIFGAIELDLNNISVNNRLLSFTKICVNNERVDELVYWQVRGVFSDQEELVEILVSGTKTERENQHFSVFSDFDNKMYGLTPGPLAVIYSYMLEDNNLKLTHISKNISAVLGYSPNDFFSDPDLWLRCVHPEDIANLKSKVVGDLYYSEYRFKDVNGVYHWIHDQKKIYSTGQNRFEVIGSWWDVTKLIEKVTV